jgi:hypothetical protein
MIKPGPAIFGGTFNPFSRATGENSGGQLVAVCGGVIFISL